MVVARSDAIASSDRITSMRWLRRQKSREVVLGTQLAAANAAEERHQKRVRPPSPLAGVAYDVQRGEFSMFRFAASATDEQVAAVALRAGELDGDELTEYRGSFTQDDLYTLLAFVRRVTVRALRGDTEDLLAGWTALGLIDVERVDWRDAAVAASLLAYGSTRAGADLDALVASASALSEPQMTAVLRDHAVSGGGEVSVGGYREISTAEGAALVNDYGEAYAPTVDLLGIAASVSDSIEQDRYRVTDITTGTDVAAAWLPGIDRETAEAISGRVRGCVSISAAPLSEEPSVFPEQTLLVYVAECATREDATQLAAAARQPDTSHIAEIAICTETLTLIAIARSTVRGVAPIETTASIERLRTPLTNALSSG